MAELKELHKRHILPGFDSRIDEEQQIEILTKEISSVRDWERFISFYSLYVLIADFQAFYACQKKLQRVAQGTKLSPEQNKVELEVSNCANRETKETRDDKKQKKEAHQYIKTLLIPTISIR